MTGPGLGGAIAHRFAQGGYHLTLLARRTDGLAKLATPCTWTADGRKTGETMATNRELTAAAARIFRGR